jgi:diguanylate cyclase (GGDEF)-like protein
MYGHETRGPAGRARYGASSPRKAPARLKAFARGRGGVWVPLAAVLMLAGTVTAILGARALARSDANRARLALHLSSAEIASSLKLSIQREEDLVVSASAFFTSNPTASPADFDRWMESVHAMSRYPELQNIGLVELVPAPGLAAFKARLAANPVRALGPHSVGPADGLEVVPPGRRPYYCIAVAGMARSAATYLPAGTDYCALSPQLVLERDLGLTGYAPVINGPTTTLGVETPVFRGGVVPATATARKRAFVGWLGELLVPDVVLRSALEGHQSLAVKLRYDSRFSHVEFTRGSPPAHAQSTTIALLVGREALGNSHEGWTVTTFGHPLPSSVFSNANSLMLLVGGSLLAIVVGLLVLVLSTARGRALSLVREKTRELSEKNLELSHQALHDTLTGLANRALVIDRAEQMVARAARQPGMVAGALFIDVDGFKRVNDNLGHAVGDQVLRTIAERLRSEMRKQDTVGRLGGDEFVVLVESPHEAMLDSLADRLAVVLREPVELADGLTVVPVTSSIGVACGRYQTPDALLRDADLALYAAKAAGKDRYRLFDASMSAGVDARSELEAELSTALHEEQFFLLYQPIFNLPNRRLAGVEALIRWQHPARGVVSPDDFIPLAEESGLIVAIGRWVLDEACRQAGTWAARGLSVGVSVNVSAQQLGRGEFLEDVRRALRQSGIEPSSLTLEITETTLMRNVHAASEQLDAIRALGVRIAIDDFGTGYASLSNLQRVPVDVLKIDKSFVAALNDGGQSRKLLEAILGVGQALSLAVVAEGIEESSQRLALEEMGCEMAQGDLMAMPERPEVIESLTGMPASSRAAGSAAG